MDFYNELDKLRKKKKQCLYEVRSLDEQKEKELEIEKKRILHKYSELNKIKNEELARHYENIDSYCQMVASYSVFSGREIGNILACLVRNFEGFNYIYQNTAFGKKESQQLAFDSEETTIDTRLRMIVAEEEKSHFYSNENVDRLVESNKAIVLSTTKDSEIPFYKVHMGSHSLNLCVKFGKFTYLKEFIDEVISYRIENKLESISYDMLEAMAIDFIVSHLDNIEENYRLIEKNREEQMKQQLLKEKEDRQARLQRMLKKKSEVTTD